MLNIRVNIIGSPIHVAINGIKIYNITEISHETVFENSVNLTETSYETKFNNNVVVH